MKLSKNIYARVGRELKRRIAVEVARRRKLGHATKESDITREALVHYFSQPPEVKS